MDSNLQPQRQPQKQQQIGSGLTRYRSAPSSYFDSYMSGGGGGGDCDQFLNARSVSPETYRIFRRFMSSGGPEDSYSQNLCDIGQNSSANELKQSQFLPSLKTEPDSQSPPPQHHHQQQLQNNGYSSASLIMYQSQEQVNQNNPAESNLGGDNSLRAVSSMAMDQPPNMKMGSGTTTSSLIRHSSSPAGFFSFTEGYGLMRDTGNFGGDNSTNAEASFSSASRLKSQMDFSSGLMTSISEIDDKNMEDEENDGRYLTSFGPWDDTGILSDNFVKGVRDSDKRVFCSPNTSENQNCEGRNRVSTLLSHHLSLPKNSDELSALEKLMQLQDSVPCRIRAKRGYATHPRSIAERVRRTRISERMRKLQDLVPNMDKQTNTADMLDLAVDYIKDLQKHVKTLSDHRSKCTCPNKQQNP